MNLQMERLFQSIRRGIEENVRLAVRTVETAKNQDFKKELKALRRGVDEIKMKLKKVEAIEPYVSALETFTGKNKKKSKRTASAKRTRKRAAK